MCRYFLPHTNSVFTSQKTQSNYIRKTNLLMFFRKIINIYCQNIRPASFRETCQWLEFPLNGLGAQSRVSPVVGLLPLASEPACLGMAFPPFLVKQLYHCDSVVVSSFMRTGYTMRWRGRQLGRIRYSITHHYP